MLALVGRRWRSATKSYFWALAVRSKFFVWEPRVGAAVVVPDLPKHANTAQSWLHRLDATAPPRFRVHPPHRLPHHGTLSLYANKMCGRPPLNGQNGGCCCDHWPERYITSPRPWQLTAGLFSSLASVSSRPVVLALGCFGRFNLNVTASAASGDPVPFAASVRGVPLSAHLQIGCVILGFNQIANKPAGLHFAEKGGGLVCSKSTSYYRARGRLNDKWLRLLYPCLRARGRAADVMMFSARRCSLRDGRWPWS
jgi:hypothetical protein